MRRGRPLLVAVCASAILLLPARASAAIDPLTVSAAPASPALVGVRQTNAARALLLAGGASPVAPSLGIWQVPALRSSSLTGALRRTGVLRWIETDRPQAPAALGAGDPLATPEIGWHLYRVGADRFTPPGPGVPVSVIDSGLDTSHVEFRSRPDTVLLNPQGALTWNTPGYHGTSVASVAAAPADGVGAVGVYPQALLQSWALDAAFDSPLTSDVVRGIDRASAAGRTVINISLSGGEYSRAEHEAILAATRRGALVVAAAGNEGTRGSPLEFPASLPHVLTVAATGRDDRATAFSSRTPAVDLAAPGEAIPVQHPADPNASALVSGTSFAAPIVSAAAAAVWTLRPELDSGQVAGVLRASARDVGSPGFDTATGFGVLDIPGALLVPPAARDPQEPNDDVPLVVPSRTFRSGTPMLVTATRRTARLRATVDTWEDPSDVYRAVVPRGRTLTVTLAPSTDLAATLWGPGTPSVSARGSTAARHRIGTSNRAGKRNERIVYRNRGASAHGVFVEVWVARGAARRAGYTLTLTVR